MLHVDRRELEAVMLGRGGDEGVEIVEAVRRVVVFGELPRTAGNRFVDGQEMHRLTERFDVPVLSLRTRAGQQLGEGNDRCARHRREFIEERCGPVVAAQMINQDICVQQDRHRSGAALTRSRLRAALGS